MVVIGMLVTGSWSRLVNEMEDEPCVGELVIGGRALCGGNWYAGNW